MDKKTIKSITDLYNWAKENKVENKSIGISFIFKYGYRSGDDGGNTIEKRWDIKPTIKKYKGTISRLDGKYILLYSPDARRLNKNY